MDVPAQYAAALQVAFEAEYVPLLSSLARQNMPTKCALCMPGYDAGEEPLNINQRSFMETCLRMQT